jgi:hypothetical protein
MDEGDCCVTFHFVGKRNNTLLQVSQASPATPDKGSMEVKALGSLGCLEALARDWGRGVMIY